MVKMDEVVNGGTVAGLEHEPTGKISDSPAVLESSIPADTGDGVPREKRSKCRECGGFKELVKITDWHSEGYPLGICSECRQEMWSPDT
jgi:hypothetical protein